jgi:hypothetical protein
MPRTARTLYAETCKAIITLMLLIVLGTVLITPDPTDDIDGIVCPHRSFNAAAIALSVVPLLTLFRAEQLHIGQGLWPGATNVLRLGCALRC